MLDLMTAPLVPQGYHVVTLNQVEDIFLKLAHYNPDVILLDLLLSGINGGEFCAQIKKDPKTSHIPVIFSSAHLRVLDSLGH